MMRFCFDGTFKPYVRMTRRGKFTDPAAGEYISSQRALAWQYRAQMQAGGWSMLPGKTPLRCEIKIRMKANLHRSDIDNQAKALIDAAQGIVFDNDLWIDTLTVTRALDSADFAIVEFEVME